MEEMTKLKQSLESDGGILEHSYERSDGHGRNSRLCIWNHPGEDITGMLAKSEKVVTTSEEVSGHGTRCVYIYIYIDTVLLHCCYRYIAIYTVCCIAAIGT